MFCRFRPRAPGLQGDGRLFPAACGCDLLLQAATRSGGDSRNLLDASPAEAAAVMSAAWQVARLLSETLGPAGFTLFQANETAGWQDVFHLHIHVVPRWSDDGLVRPWSASPADPAALSAVADRIRVPLAAPERPSNAHS
ncbi:MAG: HIT family protein [Acidothermaceae bacterium]